MKKSKISKSDVPALVAEMLEIQDWLNPPAVFPPRGYEPHPSQPGMWLRVVSEEELREEVFGSEEKTEWMMEAKKALEEIKNALTEYFFPKPKEEGTQRIEKHGFACMLKTGLDRKIDKEALAVVIAECEKLARKMKLEGIEDRVIDYKPTLKLAEFRELPDAIQKQLEEALIITPKKAEFEIVKLPD